MIISDRDDYFDGFYVDTNSIQSAFIRILGRTGLQTISVGTLEFTTTKFLATMFDAKAANTIFDTKGLKDTEFNTTKVLNSEFNTSKVSESDFKSGVAND